MLHSFSSASGLACLPSIRSCQIHPWAGEDVSTRDTKGATVFLGHRRRRLRSLQTWQAYSVKSWLSPNQQKEELCRVVLLATASRGLTHRTPSQVPQDGGGELACAISFPIVFHDAVMEGCFCWQNVHFLPKQTEKACKLGRCPACVSCASRLCILTLAAPSDCSLVLAENR